MTIQERLRSYKELRVKYPERVLLFITDDTYEAYDNDADIVSDVCGTEVVLEDGIKKTAFKRCKLDSYLPMLISAKKKIAICENIQEANKKCRTKTDKA